MKKVKWLSVCFMLITTNGFVYCKKNNSTNNIEKQLVPTITITPSPSVNHPPNNSGDDCVNIQKKTLFSKIDNKAQENLDDFFANIETQANIIDNIESCTKL